MRSHPRTSEISLADWIPAWTSLGFHLFAVHPRSKMPFAGSHGHLDASNDPDVVRAMVERRRGRCNIAVNAIASGLVVLDIDVRSHGDETLGALEREHGPLPHTPRVLSGSGDGSMHFYYHDPGGVTFPAKLGDGVEIRHRGYAVVPPSTHKSGRPYVVDVGALFSETPIAPCPEWIVALGRQRREARPATGPAAESFLGLAFAAAGWLGRETPSGAVQACCPWAHEHSDDRGRGRDSSCVILPPTTPDKLGAFFCSHGHCGARRTADVLMVLDDAHVAPAADRLPAAYTRARVILGRAARRAA